MHCLGWLLGKAANFLEATETDQRLDRDTVHWSTLHCSTLKYCSTLHCSALHCSTLHYSGVLGTSLKYNRVHCPVIDCTSSGEAFCPCVTALLPIYSSRSTSVWWSTLLDFISLYCTLLYCTVIHFTVLHCTVLHYTVLNCTAFHCSVLPWNVLYFTVVYFTVVYFSCTVLSSSVIQCSAQRTMSFHKGGNFTEVESS